MKNLEQMLGILPPFDTRGVVEKRYLNTTFRSPFSGYLGGIHTAGYWVERLTDEWHKTFGIGMVPCNSATSGLLAACIAAGIGPCDVVWAPIYTMSATASCAKVLGAEVRFIDIESQFFSIYPSTETLDGPKPKALIVTNLFGHPAELDALRFWCTFNKVTMIEDNAQAPMAMENGKFTGTIGHIGVFSLNVHKHIQVGEGGIVVTRDQNLLLKVKDAINHGELRDSKSIGLNLRMTEPIAALACAQLSKAHKIIDNRVELAEEMTDMANDISWLTPPQIRPGCTHVYYQWAAKVQANLRPEFLSRLNFYGLPMNCGYSPLLNRVFNTGGEFPVAERMEDEELITFEICAYDPSRKQRKIMREIFKLAADGLI